MKKQLIVLIPIVGLLVLMNVVLLYRTNKVSTNEQENRKIYENFIMLLRDNLKLNYTLSGIKINEQAIIPYKEGLSKIQTDSTYFVLFYSMDVCDVCEEDLFRILADYSKKFSQKLIAVVPIESYAGFKNDDKEYNLNIKTILPYKGELVHFPTNYRRAIFFTLSHGLRIGDLYVPSKPVFEKDFRNYLDGIMSKVSMN